MSGPALSVAVCIGGRRSPPFSVSVSGPGALPRRLCLGPRRPLSGSVSGRGGPLCVGTRRCQCVTPGALSVGPSALCRARCGGRSLCQALTGPATLSCLCWPEQRLTSACSSACYPSGPRAFNSDLCHPASPQLRSARQSWAPTRVLLIPPCKPPAPIRVPTALSGPSSDPPATHPVSPLPIRRCRR